VGGRLLLLFCFASVGVLRVLWRNRYGNLIERLVGSGSSSLVTPFQTLPSQHIGKVYNPFAVSLIDSHRATMRGNKKAQLTQRERATAMHV